MVLYACKNRIPYRIDRRLTGLSGPEYHAMPSRLGCPLSLKTAQYGESRLNDPKGMIRFTRQRHQPEE